jgi:hypothetical protein
MKKHNSKIIYILLFSLSLISCGKHTLPTTIEGGKTEINPNMSKMVDEKLKSIDCFPFELNEFGSFIFTDSSGATNYFLPNALSEKYKDTSDTEILSLRSNYFAYAYRKKNVLNIVLHRAQANTLTTVIEISQYEDGSFTSEYLYINDKKRVSIFQPLRYELILDKANYNVGDTVSGYTLYQGVEPKMQERWMKTKVYFKCVVGSSSNPKDYINTYPKCEGLLTECCGLGKSRNIVVSSGKK